MNIEIPDLTPNDLSRFWSKINVVENCWIWISSKQRQGYGVFGINHKTYPAHRVSYFIKHGKIDRYLVIDHLCRNPSCVNPDHLEEVTQKTNCNRGETGYNNPQSKRTHCPRGHPYDRFNNNGHRYCSICEKNRNRIRMREKRKFLRDIN